MTVGDYLRALRAATPMRAAELAARLGTTKQTVYRRENGQIEVDPETIRKTVRALGGTQDQLVAALVLAAGGPL